MSTAPGGNVEVSVHHDETVAPWKLRLDFCCKNVLFPLTLLALVGFGAVCIGFVAAYINLGPYWQMRDYVVQFYTVWTFVFLPLFLVVWFCRGRFASSSPPAYTERCKEMWQLTYIVPFTMLVSFIWLWAIPAGLFAHNYKYDSNEDVTVMRLGFVSPTSISVFALTPDATLLDFQYRLSNTPTWTSASMVAAAHASYTFTGLSPGTEYDYQVLVTGQEQPPRFSGSVKTARVQGTRGITKFSWGGCFNGNAQFGPIKYPAFGHKMLPFTQIKKVNPDFIIFTGDFVYVDHPYFKGLELEDYRIRYRESFGEASFNENAHSLSTLFMYDDHEIMDNYDGHDAAMDAEHCLGSRCFNIKSMYTNGIAVWRELIHNTNPQVSSLGLTYLPAMGDSTPVMYYDFVRNDVAFFVADCRGFRSGGKLKYTDPAKTVLGAQQLAALKLWIQTANTDSNIIFKFIVTPDPFTNFLNPVHTGNDGWSQFEAERNDILSFIQTNNIRNIHFLSSDLHVPFVATLRPGILEFSVSPSGGFGSRGDDFSTKGAFPVANPDVSLDWVENSDVAAPFGQRSSFVTMLTVDTTSTPHNFRFQVWKGVHKGKPDGVDIDSAVYDKIYQAT